MMDTPTSQLTLPFPCGVCGKIFDQKKSQIRHSSYCRKRARNPPRSRKRSCLSCTKSKCHCDSAFPTCSRCAKRGITCLYQHPTQHEAQAGEDLTIAPPEGTTSLARPFVGQEQVMTLGLVDEDLSQTQALFDDESLIAVQEIVDEIDSIFPNSLPNYQNRVNSFNLGHFYDPGMQPLLRSPRAFIPRTAKYKQLSLIRKYVICTISSYPQKLLQERDPPPFIHLQCLSKNSDPDELGLQNSPPTSLTRCSGIIALWSVKNKNNSAFIWRSIRTEQERLSEECDTCDNWVAVAALQAICIYFILRVSEQDEDVTDFDIPLIQTMLKIARRFEKCWFGQSNFLIGQSQTWEYWILAESLQRTIFTIFIVDFLFDISAGTATAYDACDGPRHLLEMRLPCSKSLWKAKTRCEWEEVYVIKHQSGVEHPRFIDLMRHDVDGGSLDKWMSEVDDFGMLIVSAATLADEIGFCPQV